MKLYGRNYLILLVLVVDLSGKSCTLSLPTKSVRKVGGYAQKTISESLRFERPAVSSGAL